MIYHKRKHRHSGIDCRNPGVMGGFGTTSPSAGCRHSL